MTSRIKRSAVFALSAALVWCVSPSSARADKLAMVPFTGPKATVMQREVKSALSGRHTLIGSQRYKKTARRLKANKPTGPNVRKVAARLRADGVLIGSTKRAGGKLRLTVWLRAGSTGKVVGSVKLQSKNGRLTRAQKRKLKKQLGGLVAKLPARGKRTRVAGKGTAKGKAKGKAKSTRVATRAKNKPARKTRSTAAVSTSSAATGARASLLDDNPARAPAFDLAAGLGVTSRRLDFTVAEGVVDLPQSYRSNPVASTHVSGAIYPMALFGDDNSLPARFGLLGGYDRVMLIESRLQYNDLATGERMEVGLGTSHSAWRVGVVYRQLFGKGARPIALRASLAFNRLAFDIEPDDVPVGAEFELPNVGYTYFDPGLSIHIPITKTISADAGGDFIIVAGRGDIGADDAYGEGSALGYRARLFVQYDLTSSLSVRAGGQLMSIGHSFDGTGVEAIDRDGDPNTLDVPAANDRYINVIATAGYQY